MRGKIIEALSFPRLLAFDAITRTDCPHGGNFGRTDPRCRHCGYAAECRWLQDNDEFARLASQPVEQLIESLRFGLEYVDAFAAHARHNARACQCEACRWKRSYRRLILEFEGRQR